MFSRPMSLVRFAVFAAVVVPAAVCRSAETPDAVRFDQQIRPIFSDTCFHCHGPDEATREADLRLDRKDVVFADLGGYQLVVPGEPSESELYRRITSDDESERMPPPDFEKSLSPEQIELLRKWIEQGAVWQDHWSFVAPSRPALPDVEQADWVRTPVDRFILARLESEGLAPSPEADRRKLIRRVTFDLTGLPPRPEEVHAFVSDTSPDAYLKVVDRLLSSSRYGEHRARYWLDVARYGDTHGLHLDNYREMWPYRDWVIDAFNTNMPYDQFTIEQLAGDLLPDATLQQQVASGFNRCHVTTNEGGSIAEEVYVRNVVDRVSTTGTAFMGLTLGCAVCHDHKFDPLSQKEFYQLFAFFNSLDGPAMDGNVKDPAPTVRVPTAAQAARLQAIRDEIGDVRGRRDARLRESKPDFDRWLAERDRRHGAGEPDPELEKVEGLLVHCKLDESEGLRVTNGATDQPAGTVLGTPRWTEGRVGGGFEIATDSSIDLGDVGDINQTDAFGFGAWVKTSGKVTGAVLSKMDEKNRLRGYELLMENRRVTVLLSNRWPGYAIKVTTKQDVVEPDKWHHVFVTYDGSRQAQGVGIYIDGKPRSVDVNSDSLKHQGAIGNSEPLLLGRRTDGTVLAGGRIDDVRVYKTQLSEADVQAVHLGSQLPPLLATPSSERTDEQTDTLRTYYLVRNDPQYTELTGKLDTLGERLRALENEVATTLVFRERKEPREAFALVRGEYDRRGEQVERRTPESLPAMPDELRRDRLGLARWLVSSSHPLTSRVAVNRLWQQLFGTGLVKTSEDFGSQGSPPSHPQLLDWLAVEFRETGWDVKRLMKQLVLSAAYRQTSYAAPELIARDPTNRLLARGPRFRLDAEMLRDQALAVSGLLVGHVGGPSVKPPQPDGLWLAVGYSGSNTVRFKADEAPGKIYRRSLYTFWKRTSPPPQMATFDAPSRESCSARRERTNTPLQALLLMNEPQYVEAARHLAERMLREAGSTLEDRIRWGFELVTARQPEPQEVDELASAYLDFEAMFHADEEAASKLIATDGHPPDPAVDAVELASWTLLSNLLLNLDEVVTKG